MSGDDVVGRLEELFSEDLAKDGGLESIPEGEKDDGDVNQGFYTMSGENAQTAASDEGLLSELDKSDSEDQEKEYSGTMRGSEDKTVLMDQDGGDLTLAVAEDETIMADSQARLPEQPALRVTAEPAADSDDDVVVSEATQIRLPASDQMAPPPEADEDTVTQYSIPNHVLTPTLADIYYQQGQPKLALQIYNRLLEADPDNERIAQRVREIERACAAAERETAETSVLDSEKKRTIAPRLEPVEQPPTQRKTPGGAAGKPLAGVRIKKIYKNRRKKNK
jgi:tetratricopeptide (TPR) repeat protein